MSNPTTGSLGFQLIELLIVLAIVAILTAVSIPVYSHLMHACRRLEAKHALASLALTIEEYAMAHHSFQGITWETLRIDPNIANHQYRLAIEWKDTDRYVLLAIPQGGQVTGGKCETLSLDADGVKGCWLVAP